MYSVCVHQYLHSILCYAGIFMMGNFLGVIFSMPQAQLPPASCLQASHWLVRSWDVIIIISSTAIRDRSFFNRSGDGWAGVSRGGVLQKWTASRGVWTKIRWRREGLPKILPRSVGLKSPRQNLPNWALYSYFRGGSRKSDTVIRRGRGINAPLKGESRKNYRSPDWNINLPPLPVKMTG